jgi:hypothetical protein
MSDLSDVKVGDKLVLFYQDGFSSGRKYVTVTRLTATLVYVGDDAYMRRTGRRRGSDGYHADWLEELTEENKQAVAASVRETEVRGAVSFLRNNLGQLSAESIIILRDMVRDWLKAGGK